MICPSKSSRRPSGSVRVNRPSLRPLGLVLEDYLPTITPKREQGAA